MQRSEIYKTHRNKFASFQTKQTENSDTFLVTAISIEIQRIYYVKKFNQVTIYCSPKKFQGLKIMWFNCDCRNLLQNNSHPQKMFLSPQNIFTKERYMELVSGTTSENVSNPTQIKNDAAKKFPSIVSHGYFSDALKQEPKYIEHSGHSSEAKNEQIPPVEVKPICKDKLTIKLNVSKANPDV